MVVFEEREVEFDYNENSGKLTLSIPVKTVLEKLNKKMKLKVKISSCSFSKEDVEKTYYPRLAGVDFYTWLAMNFECTKSGKRSLNVYERILKDLVSLAQKYGVEWLNDAISRCSTPPKCTIPYLKAILGNRRKDVKEAQNGDDRDNSYQRSVEAAVKRIV